MANTAIPEVIDALVAGATAALPGVQVFDGFGVTAEPGPKYLMVGVDDPDSEHDADAAGANQEWAHANHTARDEEGHVVCAAVGYSGDGIAKTARDDAFSVVTGVEDYVRNNTALGLANLLWASFGTRVRLQQNQDDHGAVAIVIFTIEYQARI